MQRTLTRRACALCAKRRRRRAACKFALQTERPAQHPNGWQAMQLTDDSVQSISFLPTEAAKGVVALTGELYPKPNYLRHGVQPNCTTQKEKCAIIPLHELRASNGA